MCAQKIKIGKDILLPRDAFREGVFKRDGFKCVICGNPAQDAHHILERRLFPDGGYYLSNGASLCGHCHILAEQTTISVEDIRTKAGIDEPVIPPHFYPDEIYDKWGNIVMPNGNRTRGELFQDESVQKILEQGNVLQFFLPYTKYPRTFHVPFSPGATKDDRVHKDLKQFAGKEVVVTLKYDGENTNWYTDYYHSRSLDSQSDPTQSWARALHARIGWQIPPGWRICGENLYAKHSIAYSKLPSYFLVFSIWDENNNCLSWDQTVEWATLLELKTVKVLYRGPFDEKIIRELHLPKQDGEEAEGWVMRPAESFHFNEFRNVVGKYVRAGHVQTTHHWRKAGIVPNNLA